MNTTNALERGKDRVRAMSREVKQTTRDQEPPDRITEPIRLLQLGADRADYQEQNSRELSVFNLDSDKDRGGLWHLGWGHLRTC